MRPIAVLLLLAVPSLAAELHVRVELDGGVRRQIFAFDRAADGLRARRGWTDSRKDPEGWEDVKLEEAAAKSFEALLEAEQAWSLVSDDQPVQPGDKVTAWTPACRITLEDGDGRRVTAVRRPYSALEDTKFGRIARALVRLARPAPAGTGIEFSYRIPIVDNGYTMLMASDGGKPRVTVRPHHSTGDLAEPVLMEIPTEDFDAAWQKIEEQQPWSLGDVNAGGTEGDRWDVRVWKDGVEHRFHIYQPQLAGPQPHKMAIAAVLNLKGAKGLRDVALERFRAAQLRTRVERLYQDWVSGDARMREDAERALAEIGEAAVPLVQEMLSVEKSKDVIARGDGLIERMRRK